MCNKFLSCCRTASWNLSIAHQHIRRVFVQLAFCGNGMASQKSRKKRIEISEFIFSQASHFRSWYCGERKFKFKNSTTHHRSLPHGSRMFSLWMWNKHFDSEILCEMRNPFFALICFSIFIPFMDSWKTAPNDTPVPMAGKQASKRTRINKYLLRLNRKKIEPQIKIGIEKMNAVCIFHTLERSRICRMMWHLLFDLDCTMYIHRCGTFACTRTEKTSCSPVVSVFAQNIEFELIPSMRAVDWFKNVIFIGNEFRISWNELWFQVHINRIQCSNRIPFAIHSTYAPRQRAHAFEIKQNQFVILLLSY